MYPTTISQCTVGIWQTIRCSLCSIYKGRSTLFVHYLTDDDYDKRKNNGGIHLFKANHALKIYFFLKFRLIISLQNKGNTRKFQRKIT